jgi:hypothetical protein
MGRDIMPMNAMCDWAEMFERGIYAHGSVGGGGRKPAPYPALDAAFPFCFHVWRCWRSASEFLR